MSAEAYNIFYSFGVALDVSLVWWINTASYICRLVALNQRCRENDSLWIYPALDECMFCTETGFWWLDSTCHPFFTCKGEQPFFAEFKGKYLKGYSSALAFQNPADRFKKQAEVPFLLSINTLFASVHIVWIMESDPKTFAFVSGIISVDFTSILPAMLFDVNMHLFWNHILYSRILQLFLDFFLVSLGQQQEIQTCDVFVCGLILFLRMLSHYKLN